MMNQLAIEISAPEPELFAENFMVSECNEMAHSRLLSATSNAPEMLCLCGPSSSGKTHLATLWAQKQNAAYIPIDTLGTVPSQELIGKAHAIILEDIHLLAESHHRDTLHALFHLLQHCITESISMLITSRIPPARLNLPLKDAQSRLALMEVMTIAPPDDMLLEMVLVKHFSDRQLRVSSEVRAYILKRIDRSFNATRDLVSMLDASALQAKRDITLPFVKKVWQ